MIAVVFEIIGAIAMVAGFVVAVVLAVRTLARKESARAASLVLRNTLGAAILLGLEVLVAADPIRTITSKPSIEDALILGLIVVIRTVLSMSIQIEIATARHPPRPRPRIPRACRRRRQPPPSPGRRAVRWR